MQEYAEVVQEYAEVVQEYDKVGLNTRIAIYEN